MLISKFNMSFLLLVSEIRLDFSILLIIFLQLHVQRLKFYRLFVQSKNTSVLVPCGSLLFCKKFLFYLV